MYLKRATPQNIVIGGAAGAAPPILGFLVLNATFNNISVISWRSDLLVKKNKVPGENHRPVASHRQTFFKMIGKEKTILILYNVYSLCTIVISGV
jgi:hypothetical protein